MASGWPARRIHRQNALAVDAAHAEVFDLEEFLDAVFRPFAADAAFLHAAKRGDLGRDDALVDADDAVFEPLGDAPDAADGAAVEISRKPPPFPPPLAGEGYGRSAVGHLGDPGMPAGRSGWPPFSYSRVSASIRHLAQT